METWKKFDENELTHSAAHHLLAIHEMGRQYGGWARVSDIARQLGITRGSVSINLRALKKRGLVQADEHRMVRLSTIGQQAVDDVMAKREALKTFLCEVLGLPSEQAEEDSCKIEHLISPQAAERIVHLMKFLATEDPTAEGVLRRFRQFQGDCLANTSCTICKGNCLLAALKTDHS